MFEISIEQRYMLFYGDTYYPGGGINDHRGSFETIDEAKEFVKNLKWPADWAHIWDIVEKEKINIL